MQVLQRIIDQTKERLAGLNATSRVLAGSLVIILAMALMLVKLYSGRATLVPLPVQEGAARSSAMQYLNQRQIDWSERNGQIMVPAEQRHVLLAQMTENEIIGPDQIDFDALIRQDSPFLSKAQNDRRWLIATMNHLSRTISRMDGVRRADVVIDEPSRPSGIGRAHLAPSAMVNVVTDGDPLTSDQVNAIAEMVAGAHAELKVDGVAVVDAGAGKVHHASSDRRNRGAGHYLELQESTTAVFEEKLGRALSYIPGVNIAVNVIVDHREVVEQSQRVDEPKQGLTREATRNVASTARAPGGEPGVRPNTGASLAIAARPASSLTDERSETRMIPAFGGTNSRTHDPGGYALQINAAIGVPRSYFVRLYTEQAGEDQTAPTPAELDPLVQTEIQRIREHVQPLVDAGPNGGPTQSSVAVRMIPDFTLAANDAAATVGGLSGTLLTESLVKYGSLGGLALLSLAMMFMMVRKASVRQELPSDDELLGHAQTLLPSGRDVAGEAEPMPMPLEGREVDEQMMQRQQMLQQLNELARNKPDEVAGMMRRWMRTA